MFRPILLALLPAVLLASSTSAEEPGAGPAGNRPTRISRTGGVTVLPSGRLVKPAGRHITVAPHPFGLCVSPDGRTLVSANSGTGPFSVTVVRDPWKPWPNVRQIPNRSAEVGEGDALKSVFMGLAIARDNRTLYVAGGNDGNITVLDLVSGDVKQVVSCNAEVGGTRYDESFIGDLVLSPDGRTLYAVDQANFRLVILDTASRQVAGSVKVGRYPFAVCVTPDGKRVLVANVGMYEYRPIEGGRLPFPPYPVPSNEAETGGAVDGTRVPGLGSPNIPESFSVWAVDVSAATPKIVARVKTGLLVGQLTDLKFPAVGGSSPNSVVATNNRAYVANGTNDNVQVIDLKTWKVVATIPLGPIPGIKQRGVSPFGLTLSRDGRRLYVAEAGINAVAVLDTWKAKILGHIPAGWYPSKVQTSPDGKTLYIANAKGFGAGPNGGPRFRPGPEGTYVGSLMKGFISVMPAPTDAQLPNLTRQVLANAGFNDTRPSPILAEMRKRIRYFVYINKENRTYDEVFGEYAKAWGEPSLARYGLKATVSASGQPTVEGVNVMPNHQALARRFAMNDNFHADGDVSADGHRWLVGIYPNEWLETQVAAAYGGQLGFSTKVPGRRAFAGSNSSNSPEDYTEAGSVFDHLDRHGIPFRNYGEGWELAGVDEPGDAYPTGAAVSLNVPMSKPIWENTSRRYPLFNMNISDQYRASQLLLDVKRWESGESPMPRYVNIALPNDHGGGLRPDGGYPYPESYMADNDLALGRIVEALSHTKYWKEMAIFVTEDDAQSGVDHIDAHRTILLAISPWVRRGGVSHRHGSLPSILNTAFRLLGVPALNQYDLTTADLLDVFTTKPDFTPYTAQPVDSRIFDPKKAKDFDRVDGQPELDAPAWLRKEHQGRG